MSHPSVNDIVKSFGPSAEVMPYYKCLFSSNGLLTSSPPDEQLTPSQSYSIQSSDTDRWPETLAGDFSDMSLSPVNESFSLSSLTSAPTGQFEVKREPAIRWTMSSLADAATSFKLSYQKYAQQVNVVKQFEELKHELELELKKVGGILVIPMDGKQELEIIYFSDGDQSKPGREWKSTCVNCIRTYLSKIKFATASIPSDNWTEFKRIVGERLSVNQQKGAKLEFDDSGRVVTISGRADQVELLKKNVEEISEKVSQSMPISGEMESFSNLKPFQIQLLESGKYLSLLNEAYPQLKFKITRDDIFIIGPIETCREVKVIIHEKLNSIIEQKFSSKPALGNLLMQEVVRTQLMDRLREKDIVAVWMATDTEVQLFAFDTADTVLAWDAIKAGVAEQEYAVQDVLASEQWEEFAADLKNEYQTVALWKDPSGTLISFASMEFWKDAIYKRFDDFIDGLVLFEQQLPVAEVKMNLILRCRKNEVENIKQHLEKAGGIFNLIPQEKPSKFCIRGPTNLVLKAVHHLSSIDQSIIDRQHQQNDPIFSRFLVSLQGHRALSGLEQNFDVSIQVKKSRLEPDVTSKVQLVGGRAVTFVMGNIVSYPVDTIINPTNKNLQLSTDLGKRLVQIGESFPPAIYCQWP